MRGKNCFKGGGKPVVIKCSSITRQCLESSSKKHARSLSSEAKIRVNHHLKIYPDFNESVSKDEYTDSIFTRLDDETLLSLLKSKDRSHRTSSSEISIRLKDHLEKYPDFYNSDMTEVPPKKR